MVEWKISCMVEKEIDYGWFFVANLWLRKHHYSNGLIEYYEIV